MREINHLNPTLSASEQLSAEIIAILFEDTTKSFVVSMCVALLMIVLLKGTSSTSHHAIWLSFIFASYCLRVAIVYLHSKKKSQLLSPHVWLNRFRITSIICGLAWGTTGLLIFPTGNITAQTMIALFVAGICAGALINYSIDKITAYAFTGGAMLLLCPALLLEKQTISHIILLMMLVFVIYAAVACKRMAQGILSNITLRIEADNQKKQIIQLSERQNFHLAHTPLGLIDWDHQLKITSWNKACTDILGYTLDEAIGMHISFIMPEMINKSTTHIMQSITNGHESDANFKEISHKNGNKVYCEWFNTLLKNDAGDVIGIASLVQDKTEFLRTQEKIHQLAYYDSLTSLPNRGLLLDRLNHTLEVSERNKTHAMVAFFDLDHFKAINDIKGHAAGDFLLKTIATRIQSVIRKQDTIARIGGDEFVLVLADVGKSKKKAFAYSQKIIEKISSAIKIPLEYDGYQHQCSASIGVCLFKGNQINSEELLRRADMSMYLAKKQGRNCYQVYDETMQPKYDYQMQLKHDLNIALSQNQFQLYLQGQFNRDAKSIGAEVLLRWHHPELGLIMPNDFIPLAEETGLIVPIGYWVLKESCLLLKKWENASETRDLTISVNVSAIQFNNPDFLTQVEVAIKSAGCDASKLCIELTESAVINSIEDLSVKMNHLKAMGVSLAIDDFGVGYSSLSILKDLPLTELKIDKSFVQDIASGNVESAIVQTILQMGKNLNLRIVAEGVESENQLAYLSNYGCSIFQGYFFERPASISTFENNVSAYCLTQLPSNNMNKIAKKTESVCV